MTHSTPSLREAIEVWDTTTHEGSGDTMQAADALAAAAREALGVFERIGPSVYLAPIVECVDTDARWRNISIREDVAQKLLSLTGRNVVDERKDR